MVASCGHSARWSAPRAADATGGDPEGYEGKPSVYWMDYMGALQKVDFAVHGYASSFMYSIFVIHNGLT